MGLGQGWAGNCLLKGTGRGEQRFPIFFANRACGIINICILREKSRSIMVLSGVGDPLVNKNEPVSPANDTPSANKCKEGVWVQTGGCLCR